MVELQLSLETSETFENQLREAISQQLHQELESFDDWFPLLCDNSLIIMDAYIRSNRNSQSPKIRKK